MLPRPGYQRCADHLVKILSNFTLAQELKCSIDRISILLLVYSPHNASITKIGRLPPPRFKVYKLSLAGFENTAEDTEEVESCLYAQSLELSREPHPQS